MKLLVASLALVFAVTSVHADGLKDASAALQNKNYSVAVALFTKLADAGDAEAALQLGELYWYGEGVPVDRAKGDALFARAAAAGNRNAASSLKLSAQRQARLADIAFWTSGYSGADLNAGKFDCVAPAFPPYSETKREVKTINEAYSAYTACHNGFVDHLAAAMPAGKRIPEDVMLLMSEQELGQARAHLEKVYANIAKSRKTAADRTVEEHTAWLTKTEQYLVNENKRRDQFITESTRRLQPNSTANGFPGSEMQIRQPR